VTDRRRTHAVVVRREHVSIRTDARVITDRVDAASDAANRRVQLALVRV